jgi:hypothetical protein
MGVAGEVRETVIEKQTKEENIAWSSPTFSILKVRNSKKI